MIDSHCHLDHEPLLSDLANVIQRSKKVGIEKLLTISTSFESFSRVKDLINKDEMIYGTIGIHPHESSTNIITSKKIIESLSENSKIIGIGETGLDFYYNNSEKDKQISSFKEHIDASIKTNIPLIVHSRDAEKETFEILNEYKNENLKILMHCFTGSKEVGIEKLLTISTSFQSFSKVKELIHKDEMIYGTIGIHPHESSKNIITSKQIIESLNENSKIIGIGETGLDFYYNNSEKVKQIASFKEHIDASLKTNIPLIVHSREAEKETFEILNEYKNENLKILMHCFTGSKEFSERLMTLNSFFSASGIITFKNSLDLQDTFKSIPMDNILIETDSPFLAPVPKRGKKNEPSFIDFTAVKLAEIKNISKEDLVKKTTDNFNKLFFN